MSAPGCCHLPAMSAPGCCHLPAMSAPGCCHLPGCDYSGGSEADSSKGSEQSDSASQAQYVAKVTAKDGRPLSTVVKGVSLQSDLGMCRICHEGGGGETLLSPCDCTGTLGKVHKSCLEKWLSSSNTSYCELCHTEFTTERRPQPLTQWLKDPGPRSEKRTLLCDMACFLLITPLAAISGWLCLRGAQDHLQLKSRLEAVGLIALTIALFTIYILWTLVSFRYHCQLYSEWRRTNQKTQETLSFWGRKMPRASGIARRPLEWGTLKTSGHWMNQIDRVAFARAEQLL